MSQNLKVEYVNHKRKKTPIGGIGFLCMVSTLFILGILGICVVKMVIG